MLDTKQSADPIETKTVVINPEKKRFIELRAEGKSLRDCESELGISKSTLCIWTKQLQSYILTARGIREEEFFKKLRIAKAERLRTFAELLDRIRDEVTSRTLEGIPDDKLIELMIKVESKVSELYSEPVACFADREKDFYGREVEVEVMRSIA